MINAGDLQHRVTLERDVTTYQNGVPTKSVDQYAEVWARVTPLSGRAYFAAEQAKSEVRYGVLMRYLGGVRSKDRVLWNDLRLEVVTPLPNELDAELILMCRSLNG